MFNVLSEIRNFKSNKLRNVQTKVVTADGRELIESRDRSGGIVTKELGSGRQIYVADATPDLQIAQIIPGLALGSQDSAQDLNVLKQHNITHILNLASGVQNAFAGKFAYKSLNVLDQPETNIRAIFDECFSFIDEARNSNGNALVHCNAGISRSATVVIAYLMKYEGLRYSAATDLVKSKRTIKPNDGFLKQLQSYDEELQKGGRPSAGPPPRQASQSGPPPPPAPQPGPPPRQASVQAPPPPPAPQPGPPPRQASVQAPPPTQASQSAPPRQASVQGPPPKQVSQPGPPPRQASVQGPPPRQASQQGPPPRQASQQGPPPRQASQSGSQVRIIPIQIERDPAPVTRQHQVREESEEEESEEEEEEEESEEEPDPRPMPITIVSKKK